MSHDDELRSPWSGTSAEQKTRILRTKKSSLSEYIAGKDDFSGFAKPAVAKQLTTELYAGGADVVYAAAGGSGLGAIEAAKSLKKPIVTTGTDQRYLAPEVVVTSRTKNAGTAVFTLIGELQAGKFKFGARTRLQIGRYWAGALRGRLSA